MKQHHPGVLSIEDWIAENMSSKAIGCDPCLMQAARTLAWVTDRWEPKGIRLVTLAENLVDLVWGEQQPARPCNLSLIHI